MPATPVTEDALITALMSSDPVCVEASMTAAQLAVVLDENEVSGVPVVDSQGRAIGVVSRTDLLHRVVEGPLGSRPSSFLSSITEGFEGRANSSELGVVGDIMNPDPVIATMDETIIEVAKRMIEERVHRVIVVDRGNGVVGIVTSLDMVRAVAGV